MNEKGVRLAVFFVLGMIMGSVFVVFTSAVRSTISPRKRNSAPQQEQLQDELNHLKKDGKGKKEVVSTLAHIAITGEPYSEENAVILATIAAVLSRKGTGLAPTIF